MELDVPDWDWKRPFYYDVLEGKPFTFTTEKSRIRIQLNLLMTFLKSGGQLWALEDYWTKVGIVTGQSAAIADFNWRPAHNSISSFGFFLGVYHLVNLWTLRLLSARHFVLVGHKTDVLPLFWPCVFVSGSSSSFFRLVDETRRCHLTTWESVLIRIHNH